MPGTTSAATVHVSRFNRKTRMLHIILMTTFLGLSATGLPLLFSEEAWARVLAALFGGFQGAGLVHRVFGGTLLLAMVYHIADVLYRGVFRREPGIFWGPTSMVPQPRDVTDMIGQIKWFLGVGPQPTFEHFTYWEKFDYWAVLWGTFLMGLAGLILWFPVAASRLLPGWFFNLALFVHGAEATLAIGFIFVVHFFNGHLRPGKFPMDLVIFTGSVSAAELQHERRGEFERLTRDGSVESLTVPAPSADTVRRGRAIGTTGLTIGVALIVLIIYAVLRQYAMLRQLPGDPLGGFN